jgi:undecaprenyl-diphosphatase
MTFLQSFLLGIVQGLTEFIPVSSTAHLLVAEHYMGLDPNDQMLFSFSVLVQLGTLISVFIFYWKDLLGLVKAFFARPFSTEENKLAWYIIIATLPALIFGFVLKDAIEVLFRNPLVEAAIRLLTAAMLLFLAEWLTKKNRTLNSMTWPDALFIGILQVLAVFPGASRSGTTISGGMFRGFDRPSAARFAFLMSVPVLLAAGGYQTLEVIQMTNLGQFLPLLTVGFVTAALVGWLAIKWLIGYLSQHSLYVFAAYCAVAGLVCLAISVF